MWNVTFIFVNFVFWFSWFGHILRLKRLEWMQVCQLTKTKSVRIWIKNYNKFDPDPSIMSNTFPYEYDKRVTQFCDCFMFFRSMRNLNIINLLELTQWEKLKEFGSCVLKKDMWLIIGAWPVCTIETLSLRWWIIFEILHYSTTVEKNVHV